MQYFIRSGTAAGIRTGCLVIGVFDDGSSTGPENPGDSIAGLLRGLDRSGDLPRHAGETLVLSQPEGLAARRLLVVGCGKRDEFCVKQYRRAVAAA